MADTHDSQLEPDANHPVSAPDVCDSSQEPCAICCDRLGGTRLQPCGHDCFCKQCASRVRLCPLCRAPLLPLSWTAENGDVPIPQQPSVASQGEMRLFSGVWFFVWLFIFCAGLVEFYDDLPGSCANGCQLCDSRSGAKCRTCDTGFINSGGKCYADLMDLPPVKAGGALGSVSYFLLIILTQLTGCAVEIMLIHRLRRRDLLPNKEFVVLVSALILEVVRIILIDLVLLRQYFSDREYKIFQVPEAPHLYYIASREDAYSPDASVCSTFGASSALLDFEQVEGFGGSGYNRFSRLGWIAGGQFGLIYFFATFVNEVADIIFVVPTSTAFGWHCKAFSISLEFFQLGALCAAAIFTHADCLHYTNPLNASLHMIRHIVVINCFMVWGFILTCIPLAIIGGIFVAIISLWSSFFLSLCSRSAECLSRVKASFEHYVSTTEFMGSTFLSFAIVPTLFSGIFLSIFVVVGQVSKGSFIQVLTAMVLLSDVIFKVMATIVAEATDYALHLRVTRVMAQRSISPVVEVTPDVVGTPVGS